jgi:hypothetical protein
MLVFEYKKVKDTLTGKRCKFMYFGQMEPGTITETTKLKTKGNDDDVMITVKLDNPINWGGELFEHGFVFYYDGNCSLKYMELE